MPILSLPIINALKKLDKELEKELDRELKKRVAKIIAAARKPPARKRAARSKRAKL